MLTRVITLCAASGLLALAGCAIYRPQLPATPLVGRGQVEASLGVRNFSNLEGGAAWSPLPHVLLSAEAALTGGEGRETVNNVTTDYHEYHRQAGVGVGGYWASATKPGWYVAALGGVGMARTQLYAVDAGFFTTSNQPYVGDYFVASYWRSYVQAYVAHWQHKTWSGFSVRGTRVDYQQLTFGGQPLVPTNQYFIEPTFFTRLGSGALQGQFTFGLSVPTSSTPRVPYNARTAPSSLLVGAAFILRPDLLRRRHE